MRRLIGRLGILLLGAAAPTEVYAQGSRLPHADQVRLAEAMRLVGALSDHLWPGWGRTTLSVLLVADSAEFLVGHPRPDPDFVPLGNDALLRREVWARPRRFSPTLLATFPAVGGAATIVIGSAERTGKSSTAWVLTVLHEHFHQWQYSQPGYYEGVARLDLAHGDSTGQWMLDYRFPYDSLPVQQATRRLASALLVALEAPPATRDKPLRGVLAARDTLRAILTAADYRYMEFQLWQEGVARYIEYAAARAATRLGGPSAEFRSLADYEPYGEAANRARRNLRQELEQFALGEQRRVAFYSLGAAMAQLLEESRSDWKRAYADRPFALAALLSDGR